MARRAVTRFDAGEFLLRAGRRRSPTTYRKKQIVFTQGDPADAVFYIENGQIKLTVVSERGKSAVVAMLGPGQFFGEGCLTGQPVRLATAAAVTETVAIRLDRAEMVALLHQEPPFGEFFTAYLLARNARVEEDLVDQLFNSSEKRLARILLLLAHVGKDGKSEKVVPKVSQETLAEMVGTTRPRISAFMNKFRKLGFVDYNGGLRVHTSLLNILLHD